MTIARPRPKGTNFTVFERAPRRRPSGKELAPSYLRVVSSRSIYGLIAQGLKEQHQDRQISICCLLDRAIFLFSNRIDIIHTSLNHLLRVYYVSLKEHFLCKSESVSQSFRCCLTYMIVQELVFPSFLLSAEISKVPRLQLR